jgi:hypothetical protein
MLFASRLAPGIADGSVTLTFRRWKTRQAIVGHRYRTIAGMIEVDEVSMVEPGSITDAEARSAGYEDASTLVADLRGDPLLPSPGCDSARSMNPILATCSPETTT